MTVNPFVAAAGVCFFAGVVWDFYMGGMGRMTAVAFFLGIVNILLSIR